MSKATLTSKGQITIPKDVRESLHLRTGDRVEITVTDDDRAVMKPITRSVDEVFGRLHKPGRRARSVEEMDRAVSRKLMERNR